MGNVKYLFIGGACDGERIEVPDDMETVFVRQRTGIPQRAPDKGDGTERYAKERIVLASGREVAIYVATLEGRHPIDLLLERYPAPPVKSSCRCLPAIQKTAQGKGGCGSTRCPYRVAATERNSNER